MTDGPNAVVWIPDAVTNHPPVYHHPAAAPVMACGVVVVWSMSARLRRRHADLFARPCKRCFPVGGSP